MVLFWTISVERTHLHCLRMPLYAVQCAHNIRDIHLEIQPPCKMSSTSNNVALQASVERAQQSKASVERIYFISIIFIFSNLLTQHYTIEKSKVYKTCFEKINPTFRADIVICYLYTDPHVFLRLEYNIFISIFRIFLL